MSDIAESVMSAASYIRDHRARETARIKCVRCLNLIKTVPLNDLAREAITRRIIGRTRYASRGCAFAPNIFLEILP